MSERSVTGGPDQPDPLYGSGEEPADLPPADRPILHAVTAWLARSGLSQEGLAIVVISALGIGAFLLLHGPSEPVYQADPAVPRADLRMIRASEVLPPGPCPSCAVLSQWIDRLETIEAETARQMRQRRYRTARVRGTAQYPWAARVQDHAIAARSLLTALRAAKRDCGQGVFCQAQIRGMDDGSECPAELRPLTEEAAVVRGLSLRIETLVAPCLDHACPSVSCEPAQILDARLRSAEQAVAGLMALPLDQREFQADLLASPIGTEARRLVRSTLRVPLAVPALFETTDLSRQGASQNSAILGIADEVAKLGHWADSLAARLDAAGLQATGPASGLWRIQLLSARLWRLYDSTRGIAAARAMPNPERAGALELAWGDFSQVLAALALDALRIEGEMDRRPVVGSEAFIAACQARQEEPNRSMTRVLALARTRLRRCMERSACNGAGAARGMSTFAGGGGQTQGQTQNQTQNQTLTGGISQARRLPYLEQLAVLDQNLARASQAVASVSVAIPTAMAPISVATDRRQYSPGEAMRISARLEGLACMAEPGAQAAVLGPEAPPQELESIRSLRVVEGARLPLPPGPIGDLWIAAPVQPGTYAVKTFAPPVRGGFETAGATFEVAGTQGQCQGFAGRWETDFGVLYVGVEDGEARGSYRRPRADMPGFLFGRVDGRTLTGSWRSELGQGGTRLELSADGRRFTGTWSHRRDQVSGTGTWTGRCQPTG